MAVIDHLIEHLQDDPIFKLIEYEQEGNIFRFVFKWVYKNEDKFVSVAFIVDETTTMEKNWQELTVARIKKSIYTFINNEIKSGRVENDEKST